MLNTTAVIVILLGAIFISIIGAIANYATKTDGNEINIKTVSRDFVIGLALSGAAYMFVPESFDTLGKSIQDVSDVVSTTVISGGGSNSGDMELHVGPSPF